MTGRLAAAIALLLLLVPSALGLLVYEANTNVGSGSTTTSVWSGQSVAQSFTVNENHYLNRTALRILSPQRIHSLRVEIRPDAAGLPNDTFLLASSNGTVPSLNVWYWWNFTFARPPTLSAGRVYWIVARDSLAFGQGYEWDRSGSNAYAGGTAAYKLGAGSWTTFDDDQLFVNYGTPASAHLALAQTNNDTVGNPGDEIQYRLYYNNTGNATAQMVWINDTLPSGVQYRSAYPAPTSISGGLLRWGFPSVPVGAYNLVINATLSTSLGDGVAVTNTATLDYLNETGAKGSSQIATSSTIIRAPSFTLTKSADRAVAGPGDPINYIVSYVNVGSRAAALVVIDDPMPPGLIFVNSTAEANRTGPGHWVFRNVQPGSRALQVQTRVAYNASQPAITNSATLQSYNSRGQRLQTLVGYATVLAGAPVPPSFTLTVTASRSTMAPGDGLNLLVQYSNQGGRARDLWLNMSIPSELEPTSASLPPLGRTPTSLLWHLQDVGPGNYSITLAARLSGDARSTVVVTVLLSSTDGIGRKGDPLTAYTVVDIQPGLGSLTTLLLGGLLALATAVAVFFLFRRRITALINHYRGVFDEIFLLHRSGLLIRHYSRSIRPEIDSDVIGAMLVAVQDFVKDSFRGQGLEELKVGRARLLIARGKHSILAAAVTGGRAARLGAVLASAVDIIEARCGDTLANWSGVVEDLGGIDEVIKGLLVGTLRPKRLPRFRGPRLGKPSTRPLEELSTSRK